MTKFGIKSRYASLILAATLTGMPMAFAETKNQDIVEVAFVLDTTGSMGNLIDGAKRKIWSIANTIVDANPNADIRMALVAYRDRGDEYVVRSFDLSDDIQGLYGKLMRLQADGGGDGPESVNEALDTSVRKLKWTGGSEAKKIVFLVGDAPPHMDYSNAPKYPEVLKRAKTDGIVVNTVLAGDDPDTRKIWKEIAQNGQGRFVEIPQDGGRITIIETPFDNDIIILQKKIDATVIPYGSREQQSELNSKMADKAAAPAPSIVENSKFYAKRMAKKEVVTGGGDLLSDLKNGDIALDKVKDKELPENLRAKSRQEREAEIKRLTGEREALEASMVELVNKRDDFVAKNQPKSQDGDASFDKVVKETLEAQIKK